MSSRLANKVNPSRRSLLMWTNMFSEDFGAMVLRPFDTSRQSHVLVVICWM